MSIRSTAPPITGELDLRKYMPFGDLSQGGETLIKVLGEPSSVSLDEGNLPRINGAELLYPLYSAFVATAYPPRTYYPYTALDRGNELRSVVVCSSENGAFKNLVNGFADIVFLREISSAQQANAEAIGLELQA